MGGRIGKEAFPAFSQRFDSMHHARRQSIEMCRAPYTLSVYFSSTLTYLLRLKTLFILISLAGDEQPTSNTSRVDLCHGVIELNDLARGLLWHCFAASRVTGFHR